MKQGRTVDCFFVEMKYRFRGMISFEFVEYV